MFRTNLPVRAGRMLDCFQPGSGGYGDPLARPVEYVIEDVIDGFVSREGAERDYGVAIGLDAEGRPVVDEERTRALRAGAAPPPASPSR